MADDVAPPSSDWLFPPGTGPSAATAFPKKQIASMHARFRCGPEGATCKGCRHYGRWTHNSRAYGKCDIFGHTSGAASDWSGKWPACGAFAVPDPAPEGETDVERSRRRWQQREETEKGQR